MKKTEQLLVRLTEELMKEVEAVEVSTGIKGTEMARMGLVEVVRRLKARAPGVRPELALLLARAEEHGLDLLAVLEEAIAKHAQPVEAGV